LVVSYIFLQLIIILTFDASCVGGVVDESSAAAALVALDGDDALCVLVVSVALSVNVALLFQSICLCRLFEFFILKKK